MLKVPDLNLLYAKDILQSQLAVLLRMQINDKKIWSRFFLISYFSFAYIICYFACYCNASWRIK